MATTGSDIWEKWAILQIYFFLFLLTVTHQELDRLTAGSLRPSMDAFVRELELTHAARRHGARDATARCASPVPIEASPATHVDARVEPRFEAVALGPSSRGIGRNSGRNSRRRRPVRGVCAVRGVCTLLLKLEEDGVVRCESVAEQPHPSGARVPEAFPPEVGAVDEQHARERTLQRSLTVPGGSERERERERE